MNLGNGMVYVACPYWHPDPQERAFRVYCANSLAARLLDHRVLVYSPLTHSAPLVPLTSGMVPEPEYWLEHGLRMLEICETLVIIMIPGWVESAGVSKEYERAREMGKHRVFYDWVRGEFLEEEEVRSV